MRCQALLRMGFHRVPRAAFLGGAAGKRCFPAPTPAVCRTRVGFSPPPCLPGPQSRRAIRSSHAGRRMGILREWVRDRNLAPAAGPAADTGGSLTSLSRTSDTWRLGTRHWRTSRQWHPAPLGGWGGGEPPTSVPTGPGPGGPAAGALGGGAPGPLPRRYLNVKADPYKLRSNSAGRLGAFR
jgi:hypothetical protein